MPGAGVRRRGRWWSTGWSRIHIPATAMDRSSMVNTYGSGWAASSRSAAHSCSGTGLPVGSRCPVPTPAMPPGRRSQRSPHASILGSPVPTTLTAGFATIGGLRFGAYVQVRMGSESVAAGRRAMWSRSSLGVALNAPLTNVVHGLGSGLYSLPRFDIKVFDLEKTTP